MPDEWTELASYAQTETIRLAFEAAANPWCVTSERRFGKRPAPMTLAIRIRSNASLTCRASMDGCDNIGSGVRSGGRSQICTRRNPQRSRQESDPAVHSSERVSRGRADPARVVHQA